MTASSGRPVPGPTSPSPPPGRHDLSSPSGAPVAVTIDTGVLFDGNARLPLVASAQGGHLAVYWSPPIQREFAKVAFRGAVLAALRAEPFSESSRTLIWRTFDRTAEAIETQCAELERWFTFASGLATVDETLLDVLSDAADRPILRTALAAQTTFLLSLDQRHFPHGTIFHGVQCWHPDTFLTLFYQQNPAAYAFAAKSVNDLPAAIKQRLLTQ